MITAPGAGFSPDAVLLHSFGALEVALALWVLSGWKVRVPATLMLLMLLAIVFFNLNQFQVVFRDLSIAGIALALIVIDSASVPIKIRGGGRRQ